MRAAQLGGVLRQRRDTGPTDSRRRVPEPAPSRPVPPAAGSRPKIESDSIEIPIDVVVDDNDATAIYDPRKRYPTPRWTEPQSHPPPAAPPPARSNRHLDVPPAPPEPNPPYIDEAPTEIPPGRVPLRRRDEPLPRFNPDETVKLNGNERSRRRR